MMNRLEELLIFILDRAQKIGIKNLSKFQMFKIPYLIQIFSLKYAGTPFIPDVTFIRDERGPISTDIYQAIEKLKGLGYIKEETVENKKYGHPRYAHSLIKRVPKLTFNPGEMVFLDNFLSELLPLTQTKLKKMVYSTEPMVELEKEEDKIGKIKKGSVINFQSVSVDPDVVDTYSDSNV